MGLCLFMVGPIPGIRCLRSLDHSQMAKESKQQLESFCLFHINNHSSGLFSLFGSCTYLWTQVHMRVPTYLVAQNIHGPRFTPPWTISGRKYTPKNLVWGYFYRKSVFFFFFFFAVIELFILKIIKLNCSFSIVYLVLSA